MDIVHFADAGQRKFLEEYTQNPQLHTAALRAEVPVRLVKSWLAEDEDFNLACKEAEEAFLDLVEHSVYQKAIGTKDNNFADGDGRLGLQLLQLRRREKFDPSFEGGETDSGFVIRSFNGDFRGGENGEEETEDQSREESESR